MENANSASSSCLAIGQRQHHCAFISPALIYCVPSRSAPVAAVAGVLVCSFSSVVAFLDPCELPPSFSANRPLGAFNDKDINALTY